MCICWLIIFSVACIDMTKKFVAVDSSTYVNLKKETHFRPDYSMVTGQIFKQLLITR
jgi:hypothetical protein